jgi:hypothetical protein
MLPTRAQSHAKQAESAGADSVAVSNVRHGCRAAVAANPTEA